MDEVIIALACMATCFSLVEVDRVLRGGRTDCDTPQTRSLYIISTFCRALGTCAGISGLLVTILGLTTNADYVRFTAAVSEDTDSGERVFSFVLAFTVWSEILRIIHFSLRDVNRAVTFSIMAGCDCLSVVGAAVLCTADKGLWAVVFMVAAVLKDIGAAIDVSLWAQQVRS